VGRHNHVLPGMTRDQSMDSSKPACLGHGVGFTLNWGTRGHSPRFSNDSFELTRWDDRQVSFPKFGHDVDAHAQTPRERFDRLDRS